MIDFLLVLLSAWLLSGLFIAFFNYASFCFAIGEIHPSDHKYVRTASWMARDFAFGILSVSSPSWEERFYSNKINDRL